MRFTLVLGIVFGGAFVHAEEKHRLQESAAVGDQARIEMSMNLTGDLNIKNGAKLLSLALKASAQHQFPERVLALGEKGQPARVARFYELAKTEIKAHTDVSSRTLRPDRRFMVAERKQDETVTFAPSGPLTRDELDLCGGHLDLLALPGLLPADAVAVNQTWRVPHAAAQALAGMDALTTQDLVAKLEQVAAGVARFRVSGNVHGIASGAEMKSEVEAAAEFDLQCNRLASLTWKQKDAREQGPVSPASKTETVTTIKRTFGPRTESPLDGLVQTVPAKTERAHLMLTFLDAKNRWEFLYDRQWHVVTQSEQAAVLRMLNRGELVAQLNVTPWPKAKPGEHLSADDLRKHVQKSPNFKVTQELQADQVPDKEKPWVYRLSVVGEANELQMMQNYYAVAGPQGDQVILTFTTELPQAEKLGERDLEIVGSLSFPEGTKRAAK